MQASVHLCICAICASPFSMRVLFSSPQPALKSHFPNASKPKCCLRENCFCKNCLFEIPLNPSCTTSSIPHLKIERQDFWNILLEITVKSIPQFAQSNLTLSLEPSLSPYPLNCWPRSNQHCLTLSGYVLQIFGQNPKEQKFFSLTLQYVNWISTSISQTAIHLPAPKLSFSAKYEEILWSWHKSLS